MSITAITHRLRVPGDRPFHLILVSLAVSSCGDWLYNVALLAFVFQRTGSATWVALTTAGRVLPVVVLGPIGGVLADRYDRRRLMIASNIARALLMVGAGRGGGARPSGDLRPADRGRRDGDRRRRAAVRCGLHRALRRRLRASARAGAARRDRPGRGRRRTRARGARAARVHARDRDSAERVDVPGLRGRGRLDRARPASSAQPRRKPARRIRAFWPRSAPGPGAQGRSRGDQAGRCGLAVQRGLRAADGDTRARQSQGRRRRRRLRPDARRRSASVA